MLVDPLPPLERYAYWIIGPSSIAYSIYKLTEECDQYKTILKEEGLEKGWGWLGRQKDGSDFEWHIWCKTIWMFLPLCFIHVLLSQAAIYFHVKEKVWLSLLLIFDVCAIILLLGPSVVIALLCQALLVYALITYNSVTLVWLVVLSIITTLNFDFILFLQMEYLGLRPMTEYSFSAASAFLNLRFISFSVEKIKYRNSQNSNSKLHGDTAELDKSSDKQKKNLFSDSNCAEGEDHPQIDSTVNCFKKLDCDPDLLDLLFYSFYLPMFMGGPFHVYTDFHNETKAFFRSKGASLSRIDILKQFVRLTFWSLFIEFQFHFLYFSALKYSDLVVKNLSKWSIVAMGYCQGQFFMVKYVCLYGFNMQLSRFDGIQPLPLPRCISWVYSYRDMWKYFDVGLYKFIKLYIYIPFGGSRVGFCRQTVSSAVAFAFIYWWHGGYRKVLIWCVGNFMTGSLEVWVAHTVGKRLKSYLNPTWLLRLKAVSIVPVYIASCLQVFYFFFGTSVAWIIMENVILKTSWQDLLLIICFFSANIQNALYISARYKKKLHTC